MLNKEIIKFFYKRNKFLKLIFYMFSILTISYAVYGVIIFFKGKYFSIWFNNYNNSCEYPTTWWAYISIIFIFIYNRDAFDILLLVCICKLI
jgi:hypothetical protein